MSSIGLCSLLLGIAMCDSDNMLVPAIFIFLGIALMFKGIKDEETKTHDYSSHDASYPSYLHKR